MYYSAHVFEARNITVDENDNQWKKNFYILVLVICVSNYNFCAARCGASFFFLRVALGVWRQLSA